MFGISSKPQLSIYILFITQKSTATDHNIEIFYVIFIWCLYDLCDYNVISKIGKILKIGELRNVQQARNLIGIHSLRCNQIDLIVHFIIAFKVQSNVFTVFSANFSFSSGVFRPESMYLGYICTMFGRICIYLWSEYLNQTAFYTRYDIWRRTD